jgi:hypothetical protein
LRIRQAVATLQKNYIEMSEDIKYSRHTPSMDVYSHERGRGKHLSGELPVQALPSRYKTEEWFKDTMDALEFIGITQLNENMRYLDIYRMCEGKMTYMEISEVIPHLAEADAIMAELKQDDYPRWLKHYDLIGVIINAIMEWYTQYEDSWTVTSTDEIESNAFERRASELVTGYIKESFDQELNMRLIRQGIDPFREEFASDEERAQYIQAIREQKQEMTPPEIQAYMKSNFKTAAVEWGNHTLKSDKERFQMSEMDKENLGDYLKTGRCFRNHHIGYDYYKPEVWSARNTFFSKSINVKHEVENGEYAGRIHYYTRSEFVQRYSHKLTSRQVQRILGDDAKYIHGKNGQRDMFTYWGESRVPFAQYHEYRRIYEAQEYLGQPMGMYHDFGTDTTEPQFLPNPHTFATFGSRHAQFMREDISVRNDLVQVTESYWISWRRIFYITWQREDGLVVQDIVTDELIHDFLTENGIKKINKSLVEYADKPQVNTYIEQWIPEVRYGVKANTSFTNMKEDIYLYGDPIEVQVKGDSNVFDVKLPVTGIVGTSLAEKIYPYQCMYNLSMNQLYNLMEKEIGVFFLFDVGLASSEYKKSGDFKEFILNIVDIAKSVGLFGADMSRSNMMAQGGGNYFNQFQRVDLTNTQQMSSRIEISEYIFSKALSQVGLTPQALGIPINYQTSTGVKQGLNSSLLQLQAYFDTFDNFKKRDWWVHLAIAQYCQKEGLDTTVSYTKSDLSKAYLHIVDEGLSLRTFNIMATTNSKRRRELEEMKRVFIENNTMGLDELALARIWTSDSMVELLTSVRESRAYKESIEQRKHENNLELQKKQQDWEAYVDDREHKQQMEIEHTRGQYKVHVEEIQAVGRAADNGADSVWYQWITDTARNALEVTEAEKNRDLERARMDAEREAKTSDLELRFKELAIKLDELKLKRDKMESEKYIAQINKN